jgi:hypothetical protein
LLLFKKNYEEDQKVKIEKDLEGDQKNFEVLVDALGEVIKEYMEEKQMKEGGDFRVAQDEEVLRYAQNDKEEQENNKEEQEER